MAVSATIVGVTKEAAPSTRCRVQFADGNELEFASPAEMQAYRSDLDSDPAMAQAMALRHWIARDPDASNPSIAIGKTLTFNLSSPNPIKVQ
jgi:hypothetical protein